MRINKYVARATGLSRRAADSAIMAGRVRLNQKQAALGDEVGPEDEVYLDNDKLALRPDFTTIILNKPAGYVCSREGQGGKTVYDLLPQKYHRLKTVGRLDKDTSGLLLLTDDGELANRLTHPSFQKEKVYVAGLNKNLAPEDKRKLLTGVKLADGLSKFINVTDCSNSVYEVIISEGRNRQIRRTFDALGYTVLKLHRIRLDDITIPTHLSSGKYIFL